MKRRPTRRWNALALGALGALVLFVATGCAWLQKLGPGLDASTAPDALASIQPPPDCDVAAQGTPLVDTTDGFSLCLPANWRRLLAGDDGWVTVYGARDSSTERDVASGMIQDYALPLEPPDEDRLVNLAVYVRPITPGTTLSALADAYQATMEQGGGHAIVRSVSSVPAGSTEHLAALRPHTLGAAGFDDALDAFILSDGQRAYYIVFACSTGSRDHYAPIFQGVVASLEFQAPSPSSR